MACAVARFLISRGMPPESTGIRSLPADGWATPKWEIPAYRALIQTPGGVAGWRSTGKCRINELKEHET